MSNKPDTTGKKQDTKFKKGQSGNPNGRPKGSFSMKARVKRILEQTLPGQKEETMDLLAKTIVKAALMGDKKMIQLIWNYMDGLPRASLELEFGEKSLAQIFGSVDN